LRRLFDKALVCPPGKSYPEAISSHPESRMINLNLARSQHSIYVNLLRSHGIYVESLKPQDLLPDSVFTQDPALIGKDAVLIGRTPEPSRQPEARIIEEYFANQNNLVNHVGPTATLEGGDVLVTGETVFVGITGRTNFEGFQDVQRSFSEIEVKPVKFSTEFFHLLSACSYLSDNQILICPSFADPLDFKGLECLSVASEDVVAVNALPLGGNRILMASGYRRVSRLLQDHGYEPIEIDNSEFIKGDGRITCLSSPFYSNLE
jgi:dimethylargininase